MFLLYERELLDFIKAHLNEAVCWPTTAIPFVGPPFVVGSFGASKVALFGSTSYVVNCAFLYGRAWPWAQVLPSAERSGRSGMSQPSGSTNYRKKKLPPEQGWRPS